MCYIDNVTVIPIDYGRQYVLRGVSLADCPSNCVSSVVGHVQLPSQRLFNWRRTVIMRTFINDLFCVRNAL